MIGSALDRKLTDRDEETKVYDLKTGVDLRQHEPEEMTGDVYYWFLVWDVGGAKYIMDKLQLSILRITSVYAKGYSVGVRNVERSLRL